MDEGDDEGEADEEDDATVDDDDEETDEETEDEELQARSSGISFDSALNMRFWGLYASPSLSLLCSILQSISPAVHALAAPGGEAGPLSVL